jgi:hypothetical protein
MKKNLKNSESERKFRPKTREFPPKLAKFTQNGSKNRKFRPILPNFRPKMRENPPKSAKNAENSPRKT